MKTFGSGRFPDKWRCERRSGMDVDRGDQFYEYDGSRQQGCADGETSHLLATARDMARQRDPRRKVSRRREGVGDECAAGLLRHLSYDR